MLARRSAQLCLSASRSPPAASSRGLRIDRDYDDTGAGVSGDLNGDVGMRLHAGSAWRCSGRPPRGRRRRQERVAPHLGRRALGSGGGTDPVCGRQRARRRRLLLTQGAPLGTSGRIGDGCCRLSTAVVALRRRSCADAGAASGAPWVNPLRILGSILDATGRCVAERPHYRGGSARRE